MSEVMENLIQKYVSDSLEAKAKMISKLYTIFTDTTGFTPHDLCLVEEQVRRGAEFKTLYYFDLKSRHRTAKIPSESV